MKKLIAGNWKMNGDSQSAGSLARDISQGLKNTPSLQDNCDVLICPPFIYIHEVADNNLLVGAQDCSVHESGAYTGEVSAAMLENSGCSHVILGHSERRQFHEEKNTTVADKAKAAHVAGLVAIICVGETESEREAGCEEAVVGRQVIESLPDSATSQNTVIAYEPVWAIGTGKTASADDASKMHSFIRLKIKEKLADAENLRILYGGSMKPNNAKELLAMPDIDGGLIGGASLNAEQFLAIALAAPKI
ncbi:MAG: triose-phosphate isomerase [Alphaproteobacteria bacterium]